jgi:hypothetical protein
MLSSLTAAGNKDVMAGAKCKQKQFADLRLSLRLIAMLIAFFGYYTVYDRDDADVSEVQAASILWSKCPWSNNIFVL